MKKNEYVCGMPVPNNYNPKNIYMRMWRHSQASTHTVASSHKCTRTAEGLNQENNEIGENEIVKKSDQYSKLENDEIEMIEIKVEMHDSDDEPLNKIMKLS